jgi:hypothetical protein
MTAWTCILPLPMSSINAGSSIFRIPRPPDLRQDVSTDVCTTRSVRGRRYDITTLVLPRSCECSGPESGKRERQAALASTPQDVENFPRQEHVDDGGGRRIALRDRIALMSRVSIFSRTKPDKHTLEHSHWNNIFARGGSVTFSTALHAGLFKRAGTSR